ncbi:NAD(P) transhydrogenase subunit alpha [Fodinicurvata halophila]|uniref:proton-translocating NAD(P)(+) transhydrogenase n=1 Tax=Fodinicurvata halophila TaxID=1419723 RepID=A0ABV8UQM9_9PROT
MAEQALVDRAMDLANRANELSKEIAALGQDASRAAVETTAGGSETSVLVVGLTVFVLAVFVGYHVVWRVTPALHSPLMGITNAISSVIVVGALIAAGTGDYGFSEIMGFIAVVLASVNIFGGFIVTYRMLSMFKKKQK